VASITRKKPRSRAEGSCVSSLVILCVEKWQYWHERDVNSIIMQKQNYSIIVISSSISLASLPCSLVSVPLFVDVRSPSVLQGQMQNRHGWGGKGTVDSGRPDRAGFARDPTGRGRVAFSASACQKAARMSQLSTNRRRIRPERASAPPRPLHASATRPSHPLRPASRSSSSRPRPSVGAPARPRRPGWYGVRGARAQRRRPVTRGRRGPAVVRLGGSHHARGWWAPASQQGSRPAPRPCSGSPSPAWIALCADAGRTAARAPTARRGAPQPVVSRLAPSASAQLAAAVPGLDVAAARGVGAESSAALPGYLLPYRGGVPSTKL
jgi:hypothetical protein